MHVKRYRVCFKHDRRQVVFTTDSLSEARRVKKEWNSTESYRNQLIYYEVPRRRNE